MSSSLRWLIDAATPCQAPLRHIDDHYLLQSAQFARHLKARRGMYRAKRDATTKQFFFACYTLVILSLLEYVAWHVWFYSQCTHSRRAAMMLQHRILKNNIRIQNKFQIKIKNRNKRLTWIYFQLKNNAIVISIRRHARQRGLSWKTRYGYAYANLLRTMFSFFLMAAYIKKALGFQEHYFVAEHFEKWGYFEKLKWFYNLKRF